MEQKEEKTIARQTYLSIDFLGHFVLNIKANPNKTLSDFFNDWQKSINWDKDENYSILNQGVILTHLYGLIVYPKGIFNDQIPVIKLDKINKNEWGNFEFKKFPSKLSENDKKVFGVETVTQEKDMTLEFLIRKIRNSISHARVKIDENMNYCFDDEDDTKIHFNISGLQAFTRKFNKSIINEWK